MGLVPRPGFLIWTFLTSSGVKACNDCRMTELTYDAQKWEVAWEFYEDGILQYALSQAPV